MQFRVNKGGLKMSMISLAAMPASVETHSSDHPFKAIILFCCAGLLASVSLIAHGIDIAAGLI